MSWAVWLTGVPGSGKSTLARAVADRLAGMGQSVTVLELDRMRRFVTPAPTSSDAERDVVYRALVWVAASLTEAGLPVVIDATAHRRQWRDLARAVIPRFAEVHVTCPLEVATTREQRRRGGAAPPGIYARAGRPGARVPGIDVPYEPPLAPDLVVDGAGEPIDRAAERVTAMALGLAGAGAHPAPADRWVIWITGRPGSGKSTLACGAAERLQSDGIPIKLLAFADLRALLAPGYTPPAADEILHRAVIYAARLLTRAGVAVIVDATAPRLAWRPGCAP
ncbi:MAG: adenylyl-sulfate kinase [Candidatus Rokubacteria bacterium]|nr:adenylyl-sulfate kinase [Candidatus Rokubacteria bacterium]